MKKISVVKARLAEAIGQKACVQGWIRTRRDSKGGFSFLEVNDGSCMGNLQVIADTALANYETDIKRLTTGCSVTIEGEIKASEGNQATELLASNVVVHGWAEDFPLQKKRHTFEKLREWAHLRPRTNAFGAVARVRNQACCSIHNFFQEDGFLYVHTPIITPAIVKARARCFA